MCSVSSTTSSSAALLALLLGMLLVLSSCAVVDAPRHPRPALPLPAEFASRYALKGEVVEDYLVRLGTDSNVYRGRLTCGDEQPEFHVVMPRAGTKPQGFVLCLPILAGGRELMAYVAADMAERGFVAAWGERVSSALYPHQSIPALEELFRRSIVHNRAILRWAERQPWFRPGRASLLGISTGGILGGTLLAVEDRLAAGVLIMAGGDLPDLLTNSSERRIQRWRRLRAETGEATSELTERLRRFLASDPLRTAPYVPTHKALMVVAELDTVVPGRNRELLWEGLGRPERVQLPVLSHYSAVLAIHGVLAEAERFVRRRFAASPGPRPR